MYVIHTYIYKEKLKFNTCKNRNDIWLYCAYCFANFYLDQTRNEVYKKQNKM